MAIVGLSQVQPGTKREGDSMRLGGCRKRTDAADFVAVHRRGNADLLQTLLPFGGFALAAPPYFIWFAVFLLHQAVLSEFRQFSSLEVVGGTSSA